MKIERLSHDKIRIFLTFDDLMERGIHKDDMWREIPKVHELFSEMMDQAYTELGFDANGPLAVEVFALPAQGMVVIVTRGKLHPGHHMDDFDLDEDEEIYEMEVTLEETDLVTYAFHEFDHVVSAAKLLNKYVTEGGKLYAYHQQYYLQMESVSMSETDLQAVIAILSEFGEASSMTEAYLEEYGKTVMDDDAIRLLCTYF